MNDREKVCAKCGRRFAWRPKWSRSWSRMRYCSASCRSRRLRANDRELERQVLALLDGRAHTATICLNDAARWVGGNDWRRLIESTRQAARRLEARGAVEFVQGGHVVDPSTAKGPVRIRRTRGSRRLSSAVG